MQNATALADPKLHLSETVASLLRRKNNQVWSISPDATVYQAIELMSEKQIGAAVVLMAGHLAGIVSERDYARKVILKGKSSRDTKVRDIMTAPVMHVKPQQSIEECMRIMSSRRVRHLPVVEDEVVVGMLSMGDLVNWLISSQEQTIQHLQNYIAGSYPA